MCLRCRCSSTLNMAHIQNGNLFFVGVMHASLCMCVFQTRVPKQGALHQQAHQGLLLSIQHHVPLSPTLSFLRRQKRDCFGQIAPRVLFFHFYISSYNGRFMMQLQLLYIGPINMWSASFCLLAATHNTSFIVGTVHSRP